MPKNLPIYTVDAFTSVPFAGNPAAVCVLDEKLEENTMKKIAREMNHSETCFVVPKANTIDNTVGKYNEYDLRWFTPTVEVPLCGHGTLATAHVLFTETTLTCGDTLHFNTLSGVLTVQRKPDGKLQMNFPQGEPFHCTLEETLLSDVAKCLGITDRNNIVDTWQCNKTRKLLLEVNDVKVIENLKPNHQLLLQLIFPDLVELNVKGIIVTTSEKGNSEKYSQYDFVSRYFAPWLGIPEDPVNGAMHTVLALYWSRKLNKKQLLSYQASERSGVLTVEPAEGGRILIGGDAVTTLVGTICQ